MKNKKIIVTILTLNSLFFGSFLSANCINSKPNVESEKNVIVSDKEFELYYNLARDSFNENVENLVLFYFFDSIPKISQNVLKQAIQNEKDKPFNVALVLNEGEKQLVEKHFNDFENFKTKNVDIKALKKHYAQVMDSIIKYYEKSELKDLIKDYYSKKVKKINEINEEEFLKVLKKSKFSIFRPKEIKKDENKYSSIKPTKRLELIFSEDKVTSNISQNLFHHFFVRKLFEFAKTKITDETLKKRLEEEANIFNELNLRYDRSPSYKSNRNVLHIYGYGSDEFLAEMKKIANSTEFREYLESEITEKNLEKMIQDILNYLAEDEKNLREDMKKEQEEKYDEKKEEENLKNDLKYSREMLEFYQKRENKDDLEKKDEEKIKEKIKEYEEILKDPQKIKDHAEKTKQYSIKTTQKFLDAIEDFKSRIKDISTKDLILSSKMSPFVEAKDFPS